MTTTLLCDQLCALAAPLRDDHVMVLMYHSVLALLAKTQVYHLKPRQCLHVRTLKLGRI